MMSAAPASPSETAIRPGSYYAPGDPVVVRVIRRERRVSVTDGGAAIERGGYPPGWRQVAERIANELTVNVTRQGVVWLPVVRVGPGLEEVTRRIGDASLTLYQDLLELRP
jgi:hypothetical protein